VGVRVQVRIGRYIADFACHAKRIIVEIDGSEHAPRSAADEERTKTLAANGYQVRRYWNSDVLTNMTGELRDSEQDQLRPPPLTPPTRGEGNTPSLWH
jgi:very-short-patch-repair endonuclease